MKKPTLLTPPARPQVGNKLSSEGWSPTYTFRPGSFNARTFKASEHFRTQQIWPREVITNDELQYYADIDETGEDPFSIEQDTLVITARKLKVPVFGQSYSSGLLSSHKVGPIFHSGRISACMTLPAGSGLWPAFWLYPEFAQWPDGISILPEIDVMEWIGESPESYYVNMHTDVGSVDGRKVTCEQLIHTDTDLTLTPHRFGIERDATHLHWFFDDHYVKSVLTPGDLAGPLHFMLNLAVGGTWPGPPGEDTIFPARLQVHDILIEEYVGAGQPWPNMDLVQEVERMRRAAHRCIDQTFDARIRELR